jgi:mutator protein MutT
MAADIPRIVVTAAVIEQDGAFLVTRRLEGTHLAGHWEFPGGKCDAGESHEDGLRRELMEELGTRSRVGREIFSVSHAYPGRIVELHFYECRIEDAPRPLIGQEMRWVSRAELASLQFPPADEELLEILRQPPSLKLADGSREGAKTRSARRRTEET